MYIELAFEVMTRWDGSYTEINIFSYVEYLYFPITEKISLKLSQSRDE